MSFNTNDDGDTDTERNIISVWFECKSCQFTFPFRTVPEFLNHKKQKHLEEFQNVRCIVFEERKQNELFDNSDCTLETKLFAQDDGKGDGDVELSSGCSTNKILADIAEASSMKQFQELNPVPPMNLIRSNYAEAHTTWTEASTESPTQGYELRADFDLYSIRLPSVDNLKDTCDLQADLILNGSTHSAGNTQLMQVYVEVENNFTAVLSDCCSPNPNFNFACEADDKIDVDAVEVEVPSILENNFTSPDPFVLVRRLTAKELKASNRGFNRSNKLKSKTTLKKGKQDSHGSFLCGICRKSFTSSSSRSRHMHLHYGFKLEQAFKCSYPDCLSSFNTKSELKYHIKRHQTAHSKPKKVRHKLGFKFPEPDSDTGFNVADPLTLREWLVQRKSLNTSNLPGPETVTVVNIIRLDPDPTEMDETKTFIISGENAIKCKLCRKNLESEAEVKVHVAHCWLQNKARHVYCVPCDKSLSSPRALKGHTNAVHAEQINQPVSAVGPPKRAHKCHICLKGYTRTNTLKSHLESHKSKEERERDKSFVCEICGKAYSFKHHLKTHQVTHSEEKRFKCSYPNCTGSFHFNRNLQDHLKTHAPKPQNIPKIFCCPKEGCSKRFGTKKHLSYHLRKTLRHTGVFLPKSWKCDQENCGKLYIHKLSLDRHMIAAHGIGGVLPTFECEICKKTFTWKISRILHMRSHSEDRPFKCNYDGCEKAYKDKGTLVEHIYGKHTGERPFQCELCGKAYYKRRSLKWHMGVHKKSQMETE